MTETIANLMVESLIANGIDTLYCVPGVQNDNFFDAIYDRQDELKPVQARHEQGAVYMALGAALATGKHQVFSVVPGPGFLNGTAALCTAFALNTPIFGVVGQIPSATIDKGLGLLHEIDGQIDIMRKLTKHADQIMETSSAPAQILEAWDQLYSGRPRPVAVEIPVNMWLKETSYEPEKLTGSPKTSPTVDQAQIARATRLISAAKNPLIVVGSGAQDHAESVCALAQKISAGVIAFRTGHGIMRADDDLSLNTPIGHALWPDCDLVIGLGTRLFTQKKQWGLDDKINVIHVDIDADQLNKVAPATIGIHADLADVLPDLLAALADQPDRAEWRAKMVQAKKTVNARIASDLAPQIGWLNAIRKALPEDGILVDELTQIGFVARFSFPVYKPRTFLSTGYQGTLGWGIATAIGAAHARRDVPVVSITGDGGALFTIAELASAVHHKIPVNIIVMNDNAFGNVRGIQRDNYDGRYIASDLTSPDFVALARSFGMIAERATTPDELETELANAIANTDGPNLIEVPVGEFPSPWDYILLKQVRF